MTTEAATIILAVVGVISILKFLIFKFISWKEEEFILVLPIFTESNDIFQRIENMREFCDFCGIHKKSTIVIVNYGASREFLQKIEDTYGYYGNLQIIEKDEAGEMLKKII
jgi:hypothetical protein